MKTEKCYYCGGDTNDEKDYYVHTMYYVHNRMKLWLGYKYSTKKVHIPRCKKCRSKHENFGIIWSTLLFFGLFGFIFWKFYENDKELFISLIGAGFISLFATGLVCWLAKAIFFQKTRGIPQDDEIDHYPIVNEMMNEGWIKYRPDPASSPDTGEEIKKEKSNSQNDS